jgi:tRNA (mo5U34)-methyltransferase
MVDEQAAAALQQQVDAVPYWWHSIDIGHGVMTPGGSGDTSRSLKLLDLPDDLTGKTVLDIGAWDGFYSFECERRGAARVVASDLFAWRYISKAGFDLARDVLDSRVEDLEIDVFDISPETVGMFDIVLFLGVLYHLRDPFLGLAHAASVTRERLIIETHVDLLDLKRPAIALYPGSELNDDPTNWCGPNVPALFGMLETLGFDADLVNLEPQVGDEDWLRATGTGNGTQGSRRAVIHASPRSSVTGQEPVGPEGANDLALEVIELRRRVWALEHERPPASGPTTAQVDELQDRVDALESELAGARELIAALRNMKVVRWTEWPRRIVYRLRARRR